MYLCCIMAGNSFGQTFRITTYGESHGRGIGVIIDGCPAGMDIHLSKIQYELSRRKPGQSDIVTPRNEDDLCEIISGIHNNKSLGSPIHLFVANRDMAPKDYSTFEGKFRPSHADFTYFSKYGPSGITGGGRSSARETIGRVAAGAIAKMILEKHGIVVTAYVVQVGSIKIPSDYTLEKQQIESNEVRCPHLPSAELMKEYIHQLKNEGDSTGGIIECVVEGCPVGLGEPVFDKLNADLAKAMFSINAVKGFEIGSGFDGTQMRGSEHNDLFTKSNQTIQTKTNHSGGIQGGISNGMPITCRVGFKPVSTIRQNQETVTFEGEKSLIEGKGRHDPCVVPRAVPIVEAMAALVLADHLLRNKISKFQE
ncbi:MAG: chorismate synthase [Saprospiraceae bacterium]